MSTCRRTHLKKNHWTCRQFLQLCLQYQKINISFHNIDKIRPCLLCHLNISYFPTSEYVDHSNSNIVDHFYLPTKFENAYNVIYIFHISDIWICRPFQFQHCRPFLFTDQILICLQFEMPTFFSAYTMYTHM